MQFAQPENLWSLLVLLPMIGAYAAWWFWKLRLMEKVGDRELLSAMIESTSSRRQVARAVLALLGTALLCLAFAQPQWGQTNRPIKRTGVDVVFAMDLSKSMRAQDVAPDRLEAAKNEIETTLEVLRGDRVGLVVFTAVSFVQSPLTTDYGAIRFYLDKLQPGQMPLGGTSIGRAITDGVELLTGEHVRDESESDVEMQRAKNQLIVLITDGEDHESDPLAAAQLAANNDIKVVTVGFGSKEGVRIPIYKPDGTMAGFKRDRSGKLVKTRLDSETLEEVATRTGGRYVHYSGENSVANALVDYINALEKSELETLMKERYRERFAFFLIPGIILLVLSLLLGERKKRSRTIATTALILLLPFAFSCERAFEDTMSAVDDGNAAIEAGQYEKALEYYREAEKQIPARPELHYDVGRAHLGLEQWDDAADAFARALETDDLSLRFDALYNLGLAHVGNEAWREAWETFSDALLLASRNPGAIDEEQIDQARHNLEVAWRRLHPPCKQLEDSHEENDQPNEPTELEEPAAKELTLCGLDDDWYVVGAIPGSTVSVTTTFRDLREDPDPERAFLPRHADLQIGLFDASGENVLVVDQGPTDSEPTGRTATRTIEKFRVDETMVSAESPKLLLKVSAAEHLEFEYDLDIVSIPPCHAMEEDAEDNDGPEEAKRLEKGRQQLHHCPADEDWFTVEAELGDSFFVDVQTQPDPEREAPANLTLEIFSPNDRVVARGEADGGFLTAGVRAITRPGTYHVRVAGSTLDEQGPYTLDLYQYEPCIVGDDRFEENDSANAAAPLDPQQPVQRYLRACGGDRDFYRIDFGEDADEKKVHLGLSLPTTPAPQSAPTETPEFDMDLVSPSGDQILVPGKTPDSALPPTDAEAPARPPMAKVLLAEDIEEDSAIVRVIGDHEFYHLHFLDPQQQNQQDQQNQENQPEDGQDEQSESEEQKEDSEGEQSESSEQDDGSQDESEGDGGQDEQPEPEEPQESENGEPKQEKPGEEEEAEAARPGDEDAEMERVEDILEALQQTDDNFQMRKALENMPGRYIEKDW